MCLKVQVALKVNPRLTQCQMEKNDTPILGMRQISVSINPSLVANYTDGILPLLKRFPIVITYSCNHATAHTEYLIC